MALQWELLPPISFATDRVVITGGLKQTCSGWAGETQRWR
jgi:hypothetical protein